MKKVLKGKAGFATGPFQFRRILVVFQFSISIGLIIATLIVAKQLRFIRERDLGLDRHHIVTVWNNPDLNNRFDAFKSELEGEPGVIQVTAAAQRPMDVGQGVSIDWEGRQDDAQFVVKYTVVDYDFFKTFNMELVEGRPFSRTIASDATEACVINESLKKVIGTESPLDKQIYFNHPEFPEPARYVRVIGASVSGIILLLSKEFIKWVLVANIVAWPVAYWIMRRWLSEFAYRIDISIGVFILSAMIAFAIAMGTVSYQAAKTALANPIDSLRYE